MAWMAGGGNITREKQVHATSDERSEELPGGMGRWGRPGEGRHGLAGWAGGPVVLRRFQAGLAQVAAELPGEQDGVDHKWNERAIQGTGEVSPAEPAPYSRIPARKRGPSSWSLRRPTPLICSNGGRN